MKNTQDHVFYTEKDLLIAATGTGGRRPKSNGGGRLACDVVKFTAAHFFWILWCATIPLYQMEIKLLACVALKKLRRKPGRTEEINGPSKAHKSKAAQQRLLLLA